MEFIYNFVEKSSGNYHQQDVGVNGHVKKIRIEGPYNLVSLFNADSEYFCIAVCAKHPTTNAEIMQKSKFVMFIRSIMDAAPATRNILLQTWSFDVNFEVVRDNEILLSNSLGSNLNIRVILDIVPIKDKEALNYSAKR